MVGILDGCGVGGTLGAGVMVGYDVGSGVGTWLGIAVGTNVGLIGDFNIPASTRLLIVLIWEALAVSLSSPMSHEVSASCDTCPSNVTCVASPRVSGEDEVRVSIVAALLSTPSVSSTTPTMDDIIITRLSRRLSAAAVLLLLLLLSPSPPPLSPSPPPLLLLLLLLLPSLESKT